MSTDNTRLGEGQLRRLDSVSGASIGEYLIGRLQDYGVRHVFGIPGDYVLAFYAMLEKSPLGLIGCTREDCAGFAADAYARINGIGAVCVTYCVGGLSLCNSVAGAFAEKSPVVVISGSPGIRERLANPLLHHRVKGFRTQADVFSNICCAVAELNDPHTALAEIDRVLAAIMRFRQPGYIELPRDLVAAVPEGMRVPLQTAPASDPESLCEAVGEATRRIAAAERPIILAGVEIHRFGLQCLLLEFAQKAGIPIAATMLGKSVISERNPLFAGIYEGALGREDVTRFVEESDCVILLGEYMTDINMGIFTAHLDPARSIDATAETLRIGHHYYNGVLLGDFIKALAAAGLKAPPRKLPPQVGPDAEAFQLRPNERLTIRRLIARLNQSLEASMVVIADPGDALFASSELLMHRQTEYVSPAYYTSMGFAVPAALGVMVARPKMRPIVLVGDGAFQMTGMELSSIIRNGFCPVVIVLDNGGYGTERVLMPGEHSFNDIRPWQYSKLPEVLGAGKGHEVRTEGDFDRALTTALADRQQMHLLHVHLGMDDFSPTLVRLMTKLRARV
jgi:indolepyruvate decarboxylase